MLYDEPLFRPPSEANSAIVQATLGCAWNRCLFCDMYRSKPYRIVAIEEIESDLRQLSALIPATRKLFLADGNAFVLPTERLLRIAELAHHYFPHLHRLSAYSLPRDIASKSAEELKLLRNAGFSLLYVGVETGSETLLTKIRKSETRASIQEGVMKAHEAGIATSIMIISGLGGRVYSQEHAIESATLLNLLQPKFLSTLTLFLPRGLEDYQQHFQGKFEPMLSVDILGELEIFITTLALKETIFRSNHVSNSLPLEGILNRDREKLLRTITSMRGDVEHLRHFSPEFGY